MPSALWKRSIILPHVLWACRAWVEVQVARQRIIQATKTNHCYVHGKKFINKFLVNAREKDYWVMDWICFAHFYHTNNEHSHSERGNQLCADLIRRMNLEICLFFIVSCWFNMRSSHLSYSIPMLIYSNDLDTSQMLKSIINLSFSFRAILLWKNLNKSLVDTAHA